MESSTDLAADMVAGLHRFLDGEISGSQERRRESWRRDFSSWDAYRRSVQPNRERLSRQLGVIDERLPVTQLEYVSGTSTPALIGETPSYRVFRVRWPVLEGFYGEGLLLEPKVSPLARVVALPDADQTPELAAGLLAGAPAPAGFAARLAEAGCQVVIPALLSRDTQWSGNAELGLRTNQTHREWIYRQAYQLGRHVIGFEIQQTLALVDWFGVLDRDRAQPLPVGLAGFAEGGLLALYTAALDERIDTTLVSAYFDSRQDLWTEPIYRNVHGLLAEFGDAEIASLIAPRRLIVEQAEGPRLGPPEARQGERVTAAPGELRSPDFRRVEKEWERFRAFFPESRQSQLQIGLIPASAGSGAAPMRVESLEAFLPGLVSIKRDTPAPSNLEQMGDLAKLQAERQRRLVAQLQEYCQELLARSESERRRFWSSLKPEDAAAWDQQVAPFRRIYHEEILGVFPPPSSPAHPRTRALYDSPRWRGYEVVLDVWPEVFAYGILLVPKDLRAGEKRPLVVTQHGLEGRPQMLVDVAQKTVYHAYGAALADRGFVVFAPQNPYIGKTEFRPLNRKANPLGKTYFGIIVRQHQRIVEWLQGLPFVDGERMGFYGLSYGGVSAMRLGPLIPEYKVAICSANFNDWVYKIGSIGASYTYLYHQEFEMFGEFDVARRFNYFELASMIAPRAFMVERGHGDGAGIDELIASEYAKIRRLYLRLGIPERTAIEFFDGGHEINAQGTFDFLESHLGRPVR